MIIVLVIFSVACPLYTYYALCEDRYMIMRKCWHPDPRKRPEFSQLSFEIREMVNMIEQAMKQGEHMADIQTTYVNLDNCTSMSSKLGIN